MTEQIMLEPRMNHQQAPEGLSNILDPHIMAEAEQKHLSPHGLSIAGLLEAMGQVAWLILALPSRNPAQTPFVMLGTLEGTGLVCCRAAEGDVPGGVAGVISILGTVIQALLEKL